MKDCKICGIKNTSDICKMCLRSDIKSQVHSLLKCDSCGIVLGIIGTLNTKSYPKRICKNCKRDKNINHILNETLS